MPQIKFTNIDLGDIPRTAQKITFVASDLGVSKLKTELAFRDITNYKDSAKDDTDTVSYLGTPVYDTFSFGNLTDKEKNSYINILGQRVTFKPFVIYQGILTVTQTRNIVSTQIQGRNGTLKQYISAGDFIINLTGRISGKYNFDTNQWVSYSNKFPETETKALIDICNVNTNIDVSSSFLQLFGITKAVITDYSFTQREGNRNEQVFDINMLSDTTTILDFTEEDAADDIFLKSVLNQNDFTF